MAKPLSPAERLTRYGPGYCRARAHNGLQAARYQVENARRCRAAGRRESVQHYVAAARKKHRDALRWRQAHVLFTVTTQGAL